MDGQDGRQRAPADAGDVTYSAFVPSAEQQAIAERLRRFVDDGLARRGVPDDHTAEVEYVSGTLSGMGSVVIAVSWPAMGRTMRATGQANVPLRAFVGRHTLPIWYAYLAAARMLRSLG